MGPPQLTLLLLLAFLSLSATAYKPPMALWNPPAHVTSSLKQQVPAAGQRDQQRDLISNCKLHWRNATLDHFTWAKPEGHSSGTFPQRVFVCSEYWRPAPNGALGPIFFYLGNEADVTLYLNHTGLMWENAPKFGALMVFAEHRYYGESKPWGSSKLRHHMGYLTAEQALADYAEVITEIRTSVPGAAHSPVIGFGGSYGGMLATWMRLKYPHLMHGAVAASAPIWNFFGEDPPFDPLAFAEGVTYDASEAAGSPPGCVDNVRKAWQVMVDLGRSQSGRSSLSRALRLCPAVNLGSMADVLELRGWLASAWDYLAMGNFPYPCSYMTNGAGDLPAYPVRVACGFMTQTPHSSSTSSSSTDSTSSSTGSSTDSSTDSSSTSSNAGSTGSSSSDDDLWLLSGLAQAAGVLYNFSGTVDCFSPGIGPSPESDEDSNFWDYQWCTEMLMPSARDGVHDLYWSEPFDLQAALANCKRTWGVQPRRRDWATIEWGGREIAASSNIVFSNGLMDPWHGTGVLESISDSLVAVIIPEGAHHLDLMFSHPLDPASVTAARQTELKHITKWIQEASQRWQDQRERLQWWQQQQQQGFSEARGDSESGVGVLGVLRVQLQLMVQQWFGGRGAIRATH